MKRDHDIELNLDKIEKLGKQRLDENFQFRTFLKGQDPDKIDRIVHQLNWEVSSQIDCTKCGNCCKSLKPGITQNDLEVLSKQLNMTTEQIVENYTETNDFGELFFRHAPCKFLKDKKCTIYEDRPEACRSYPHLHKDEFTFRLFGVIQNYSVCPIVFNVFEKLKDELNFR